MMDVYHANGMLPILAAFGDFVEHSGAYGDATSCYFIAYNNTSSSMEVLQGKPISLNDLDDWQMPTVYTDNKNIYYCWSKISTLCVRNTRRMVPRDILASPNTWQFLKSDQFLKSRIRTITIDQRVPDGMVYIGVNESIDRPFGYNCSGFFVNPFFNQTILVDEASYIVRLVIENNGR